MDIMTMIVLLFGAIVVVIAIAVILDYAKKQSQKDSDSIIEKKKDLPNITLGDALNQNFAKEEVKEFSELKEEKEDLDNVNETKIENIDVEAPMAKETEEISDNTHLLEENDNDLSSDEVLNIEEEIEEAPISTLDEEDESLEKEE